MDHLMSRYSDPLILIPMGAMFVIIFGIVLRALCEILIFAGDTIVVITLCVTTSAIYGMDQTLVRAVVREYTVMGVAMLFGFAGLLLAAWVGLAIRTRECIRWPQQDEEGRR